jgi:hypothetical protein
MMDSTSSNEEIAVFSLGPAVAALVYPGSLYFFHESVRIFHSANHIYVSAIALITAVLSLSLAYVVPAFSFVAAYALGTRDHPSRQSEEARLLAHLAFSSPPLFTAIGVLCFLLHAPRADYLVWLLLWIALGVLAVRRSRSAVLPKRSRSTPVRVRMIHGISALAILLVFLVGHMANHVVGIWNLAGDIEVMNVLRTIYRVQWLQPEIVGLFVFQIVSGLVLLGSRMTRKTDLFGVLQTTSGMYLATFLISHMTAVFVLGRIVLKVDTNDAWAAGLPAGMVADLWNTRLIPHYSLAAFLLIAHLGCGLRGILLDHAWSRSVSNRITAVITGIGAAVATVIILALLGVHLRGGLKAPTWPQPGARSVIVEHEPGGGR